jgi:hypothetical protein
MFQACSTIRRRPTTKEVGSDFSRWGFFASGTIGRGEPTKVR